eukprot:s286_g14.t1
MVSNNTSARDEPVLHLEMPSANPMESRTRQKADCPVDADQPSEWDQDEASKGVAMESSETRAEDMPFGVEFCSGTAGLTAQLRKLGMKASFGVDRVVKSSCKAPVIKLDLTDPQGEALAQSYLRDRNCKYSHFGIPCGTCSRAREIPIEGEANAPKPLRSPEYPEGLPGLGPQDQERVDLANKVYSACARLIITCIVLGIRWTLEQPSRSLFWLTKYWRGISTVTLQTVGQHCLRCRDETTQAPASTDKKARHLAQKQTRKSISFMPEFSHVATATGNGPPPITVGQKLATPVDVGTTVLPTHSRILRITKTGDEMGGSEPVFQVAYGVPWTIETFIAEAIQRGHPVNLFDGMAPSLQTAIDANSSWDPDKIVIHRSGWLKKWTTRAMELSSDEQKLHATLPKHRRDILRGKRFLVLKEMVEEMKYPDPGIVDSMIMGFDLVGQAGGGDLLPPDFQPATLTVHDLEDQAIQSNKAILHSTKSSGSPLVDAELWEKTLEEEKKGWLSRLTAMPEDKGRVSRRFAVVQSEKVRPIDNYSESQINNAVTITSQCTVDGVDTIAAMMAQLIRGRRDQGKGTKIVGRSFDLKSAYRQLAVSDDSLKWARLAVYNPHRRETVCFQQYSLPFGAKASVVAFLRCARLLQWLAHYMLIVVSFYFDDYVSISTPELAHNTEVAFSTLLELLGWAFDKSGDKSDSMSEEVAALGVLFDLSQSHRQQIFVKNTEKRKADVCGQIADALRDRVLTAHAAASLKGRLGFAEGQLFGRSTRRLLNELGNHALAPPRGNKLKESTLFALATVADRMIHAKPRMIEASSGDVFFLFTDASFNSEAKTGGLGGVLLDQTGVVVSWFGGEVDEAFCKSFMAENQEQAIGELEAFAVLVALCLWGDKLASRHLVSFLDNEGSRCLILKGYSSNLTLAKIVHEVSLLEEEKCILAWYSRVPTEANVSDLPSRGISSEMLPAHLREHVESFQAILDSSRELNVVSL